MYKQLFYDRDDTEWDGDGDEVRPYVVGIISRLMFYGEHVAGG